MKRLSNVIPKDKGYGLLSNLSTASSVVNKVRIILFIIAKYGVHSLFLQQKIIEKKLNNIQIIF